MSRTLSKLTGAMLGLLSITAAILLSASVPHLNLRPGVPLWQILQFLIGEFQMSIAGPVSSPLPGGQLILDLYRIIFTIALVCFPFAAILVLLSPELRRRVLRTALTLAVLFAAVSAVLSRQVQQQQGIEGNTLNPLPIAGSLAAESPIDESFSPERISPWIARALSLLAAMLIAGATAGIIRAVRRSRAEARTLRRIAAHARTAIADISRGGDLGNIIIRCYADMNQVVRERRGLLRERSVTAREFTDHLLRANLPRDAVVALTRLFEKARYSATISVSPEDQQIAVASLEAIIKACEEPPHEQNSYDAT